MKRHVQTTGVRQWAGGDLVDLQAEPLKAIDAFFREYGSCILSGCEVVPQGERFSVTSGMLALEDGLTEGQPSFKVAPFEGVENIVLPVYLTLSVSPVERAYVDGKVKPIAYDYKAVASGIRPPEGTPFVEIGENGGTRFVDAIHLTDKLDRNGNGKEVTVTFSSATERENVTSGEKLSSLWGKVCKWFGDLKAVAFSGRAADLTEDTSHRFLTDAERTKLNGIETGANNYAHPATHPATMITDDAAHRFVSDTEKNAWNGKAAGTHTHPATQVTEDATHRFLTDAERSKLNGIETGANKYTHPATHPATLIVQDATHRFVTDTEKSNWNSKAAGNHTHNYAAASHTHSATQVTEDTTHRFVSDTEKSNWNSKAAGSHNHSGIYAPVSHIHTADQISDTATKVMMTKEERSKLGQIEMSTHNMKFTGVIAMEGIKVNFKNYSIFDFEGKEKMISILKVPRLTNPSDIRNFYIYWDQIDKIPVICLKQM